MLRMWLIIEMYVLSYIILMAHQWDKKHTKINLKQVSRCWSKEKTNFANVSMVTVGLSWPMHCIFTLDTTKSYFWMIINLSVTTHNLCYFSFITYERQTKFVYVYICSMEIWNTSHDFSIIHWKVTHIKKFPLCWLQPLTTWVISMQTDSNRLTMSQTHNRKRQESCSLF